MMNVNSRRLLLWVIVWGVSPASLLLAEDLPLKYRKAFQLSAPAQAEPTFVAVELDADVYAATKDNYADLRILDPAGKPVPYLLHPAVSKESRKKTITWNAAKPGLKPLDGEGLEITIQLQQDKPVPKSVQLITPLDNFEQQVQVLTSADGTEWTPAVEEALIYDYSQYMDVRNTRIRLPAGKANYYRFIVDKVTAEQESQLLELTKRLQGEEESTRTERTTIERRPFRIDRIQFSGEVTTEQYSGARSTEYPIVSMQTVEKKKEKQTWLEITTQREPLTEFRLQTAEKNFSRAASVQVEVTPGEEDGWRTIGSATLSRIDFKSLQQEDLTLHSPETRAKRYRILIENRDSPPITVSAVAAFGKVYEVVFLAERAGADEQSSEAEYQLAYGGEIKGANYDTASIQRVLGSTFSPETVTLGKQTEVDLVAAPEKPFAWSDLLNNKPLLFSVIGLLVLALGWGLFQAAKRVEQLPPE